MTKQLFLDQIAARLSTLPYQEVSERLSFYGEMIDDRIEDGMSEAEAITAIGSVDSVTAQILADISLIRIAKEKIKARRTRKRWETVLLWVGSPVWIPLLLSAFAVVLSLYASLWAVVISLWACFGALIGSGVGVALSGILLSFTANLPTGVALIGAGAVCTGLSIFFFYLCRVMTVGTILLPKKIALGIKKHFLKKEDASC